VREALDTDNAAGQADQDRREDGCHARYITFQLAEVAVPRRLYRTILNRIRRFAAIMPRAAPIWLGARTGNVTNACGVAQSVWACLLKDTAELVVENASPPAMGRFRLGERMPLGRDRPSKYN
jgi:hypothetical protein